MLTVAAGLCLCLPAAFGQIVFTDNFDAGPSPLWSNLRGSWSATGGVYSATVPDNVPPTFTGLPFVLENFAIDVDINQVADGGIWLRCDASGTNGVLLVTGGRGWGSGVRAWPAGRSLYWHVITPANWSNPPILNEAFDAITIPEVENVHLRVEVEGTRYAAFLNGSTNATTTLIETDQTYGSGHVGLYDYSVQTFDNVVVTIPPGYGPYRLEVAATNGTQVVLSWPTNAVGWVLEHTNTLPSTTVATWPQVPPPYETSGTNFQFIVSSPVGNQFFRLHKP
jgi:hypothetical protein